MASSPRSRTGGSAPSVREVRAEPEFRPTVLQSRYFLSAYLRFVLSVLVLAGVYTLAVNVYAARIVEERIQQLMEAPHGLYGRNLAEYLPEFVGSYFPMWKYDAGLLEGYLHLLWWLLSWGLVAGTLFVAGAVALALERSVGS